MFKYIIQYNSGRYKRISLLFMYLIISKLIYYYYYKYSSMQYINQLII